MFEDRYRRRKSNILMAILLVISLATAIGLFLNGTGDFISKTSQEPNKLNTYQVPIDLVNPKINKNEPIKQIANIPGKDLLTPNTVLVFDVDFELCGHSKMKRSAHAADDEINLTEDQTKQKYKDWQLLSFDSEKVVFRKTINTHCPDHFIVGVKGESIAVYKYNIDGQKILIDETDIQLSTLTPEDQEIVKSGIVTDTEDELQGVLEGFSD